MREAFAGAVTDSLDHDERVAVVLADISTELFEPARRRHPERVINVGIREQLMIGVAAGLAAEGMRPVAHSYAPFLLERPFESLKVDLGHQGLGAVLVSVGASHDEPGYGRTHACPEDVSLLDALTGWRVVIPGHPHEAGQAVRQALAGEGSVYLRLTEASNSMPHPSPAGGRFTVIRRGHRATVVAVGPLLDATAEAVRDLDVTLLYATTVRPFDADTLLATLDQPAVVLVEPYLAGTSIPQVSRALGRVPHRVLGLGIGDVDLHRYGTRPEHDAAHGLDAPSLRRRVTEFLIRRAGPARW
jgi:transketolase